MKVYTVFVDFMRALFNTAYINSRLRLNKVWTMLNKERTRVHEGMLWDTVQTDSIA